MYESEPERVLDQYLVALARSGSRAAFDRLAHRWSPRLLRYAARTVGSGDIARDVVQETWMSAIRALGALADPASFPAWIYAITNRKCIDAIRGQRRRRRLAGRAQLDADATAAGDAAVADAADSVDLGSAFVHLSEEQRQVVNLFYGENLGVGEIAEILSIPAGTVKSRLFHAREVLKKQLGE